MRGGCAAWITVFILILWSKCPQSQLDLTATPRHHAHAGIPESWFESGRTCKAEGADQQNVADPSCITNVSLVVGKAASVLLSAALTFWTPRLEARFDAADKVHAAIQLAGQPEDGMN